MTPELEFVAVVEVKVKADGELRVGHAELGAAEED